MFRMSEYRGYLQMLVWTEQYLECGRLWLDWAEQDCDVRLVDEFNWWKDLSWIPFFVTSLVPSKISSPFDDPCNAVLLVSSMVPCWITSLSTDPHCQIYGKRSQENPTFTEPKHGKCNVCWNDGNLHCRTSHNCKIWFRVLTPATKTWRTTLMKFMFIFSCLLQFSGLKCIHPEKEFSQKKIYFYWHRGDKEDTDNVMSLDLQHGECWV